jgi:hypothetical protein
MIGNLWCRGNGRPFERFRTNGRFVIKSANAQVGGRSLEPDLRVDAGCLRPHTPAPAFHAHVPACVLPMWQLGERFGAPTACSDVFADFASPRRLSMNEQAFLANGLVEHRGKHSFMNLGPLD